MKRSDLSRISFAVLLSRKRSISIRAARLHFDLRVDKQCAGTIPVLEFFSGHIWASLGDY
jgi:hypothetical protein